MNDTKDFSFILDNMRFSYSSANTYNTCALAFFLTYINAEKRVKNAFSDFGILVHEIIEKSFKNELSIWDLPKYYTDNYSKYVISDWPPYPAGMAQKYFDDGLKFFEEFEFDIENYDILMIEDNIKYNHKGIDLIVKPDAVLKNKNTGKISLIDFKTSKLKGNKYDDAKINEYKNQMYLYVYFIFQATGIVIDDIKIWFIRNNIFKDIPVDNFEMQNSVEWFENTVDKIKKEKDWVGNNTPKNQFFCTQLCSQRQSCPLMNKE